MEAQQQVTVNRRDFLSELEWVARFVDKKSTIPILTNVELRANDGVMRIAGTDLEVAGISRVDASGEFAICIPVTSTIKYLKKLDGTEVALAVTGAELTITQGNDSATVSGMSIDGYPELPTDFVQIGTATGLHTAIQRTLVSVSHEESRFTLNGALLNVTEDEAVLVGTDGHRLSLVDLDADLAPGRMLIPTKALAELARLAPDTERAAFGANDNHVSLNVGKRIILARKLTGNFPDYNRVIPKPEYSVDVPVAPLLKVIDRVSTFSDTRSGATIWQLDGETLTISASISETSKAKGSVGVNTMSSDASGWISSFNHRYMTDGLKLAGDTCALEFSETKVNGNGQRIPSAAMLIADQFSYVVMPLRID